MIHFGTGGWRAVIGDEFIRSNIELLAAAMCVKMKQEGADREGIVLGYDRRFLSKETMRWCGSVFAAEGIRAKLINRVCGFDYVGETNVIDVYVRYLRSKIDDPFRIRLIETVRGVGYVIRDPA